jgi:hypothetical protein
VYGILYVCRNTVCAGVDISVGGGHVTVWGGRVHHQLGGTALSDPLRRNWSSHARVVGERPARNNHSTKEVRPAPGDTNVPMLLNLTTNERTCGKTASKLLGCGCCLILALCTKIAMGGMCLAATWLTQRGGPAEWECATHACGCGCGIDFPCRVL